MGVLALEFWWLLAAGEVSIASRAEGYPYLRALSGCEVARSGPGGGRVGGGETIPCSVTKLSPTLGALVESAPGGFTESTAQSEPRHASSPRFLVRARGARHQVAAGVVAGRRCSYGDAADRQRDRANGGLPASGILSAFSRARARSPSSGGGGGRGRAPVQLRGCC